MRRPGELARSMLGPARTAISARLRLWKAPRMIRGYRDSTGAWQADTRVSDTTVFHHPERVRIGDHVFVGHFTLLDGTGGLDVGEGTQLAGWTRVYTHSSHIAIRLYGAHYTEVPEEERQAYQVAPVRIGKYVWIGSGTVITSGVTIGNGSIIRPGSFVDSDVPAFAIVSGDPARVVTDVHKLDEPYISEPSLRMWYEEWQRDR